jgi:protein-disulfide isomerase
MLKLEKKLWWIYGVLFITLVFILIISVNSSKLRTSWQANTKRVLTKDKTEAENLRELNNKALEEIANVKLQPVPPLSSQDFVTGSRQAPITLVVYYDFSSPFSGRFHEVVKQVISKYGSKIDVVWRVYPLAGRETAATAATAFVCAGEQGMALNYAGRLFALERSGGLIKANYIKVAQEEKIDVLRFTACLDGGKYEQTLGEQKQQGETAGVTSVPYSFLNGRPLPGSWQFKDFRSPNGEPLDGLDTLIDKLIKKL